jgi:hypothetical protein
MSRSLLTVRFFMYLSQWLRCQITVELHNIVCNNIIFNQGGELCDYDPEYDYKAQRKKS